MKHRTKEFYLLRDRKPVKVSDWRKDVLRLRQNELKREETQKRDNI